MRSCTIRFAAIAFLLLAPHAQAAEGEGAPTPMAVDAAPTPENSAAGVSDPPVDAGETAAPSEIAAEGTTAVESAEGPVADSAVEVDDETAAVHDEAAAATTTEPTDSPVSPASDTDADELDAPAAEMADTDPLPAAPAPEAGAPGSSIILGPLAVDPEGRRGRIHTVVSGDTLWDVSEAYLGTPWVWPAVWTDNDEIQNPHLINPGDHIWVSAGEMRIVSQNEADSMIAAGRDMAQADGTDGSAIELEAAEMLEGPDADEDMLAGEEPPAALDPNDVTVPLEASQDMNGAFEIRVVELEVMGFVTIDAIEAASSIVDSPSPRVWLVDGDMIDLGIGEGIVDVDDEFTIFRDAMPVYDVDGGGLLGYHVEVLGWAVVREVIGETALSEIRMSRSEVRRGNRVIRRPDIDLSISIKNTPGAVEGKIVYMPYSRTRMGDGDHVYINRGSVHGFEIGSEVEVYVPGAMRSERVSGNRVMTPDRIVGRMVLVEVKPESSVAYVVTAMRELERGDHVRASTRDIVSR